MPFYFWLFSMQTVFMIAFAIFFYRAGEMDRGPSILWAGLSILTYLGTRQLLGWGIMGCLVGQVALFFAIALVRTLWAMLRSSKTES